jgi:hypothetical protein
LLASLRQRPPAGPVGRAGRWRLGLVAHYLFSSPQRRGLIVRWDPSLTAGQLAAQIEGASAILHVSTRGASAE